MPRFSRIALCVVAAAAIPFAFDPLLAQQETRHTIIVPDVRPGDLYARLSGYQPDSASFGAYALAPMGETLYVGLSTAEPATQDGALLAAFDGDALRPVATITEQGIHEIVVDGARLLIPGTDPSGSDDWSAGNLYIYQPGKPLTKHRSQPNVIHTWGLFADGEKLYAAAAAHTGEGESPVGLVLTSSNSGADWTELSAPANYSLHDITSFDGALYATMQYADASWLEYNVRVSRSADGGVTWREVSEVDICPSVRFVHHGGKLLSVDSSRSRIVSIDGSGNATTVDLPFSLQRFYHSLAPAADGYLYAITDDRRVMRSGDLDEWEEMAVIDGEPIAIVYWPARNAVVVSERGAGGMLRVIPVSSAASTPLYLQ